jgi:hypothetical protein
MSLQSIPREIRHTISRYFYFDIDMVNAHPVILLYLCKKTNFDCPALSKYVKNREKLFKLIKNDDGTLVGRDKAKQIYLSLTNGGTKDFNSINNPSKHLVQYKKEMTKLHSHFTHLDYSAFKKIKDKRINNGKFSNHEAGYVNSLLCDMENDLLQEIYKFFGKPQDAVLCFDGIMLRKGKEYNITKCMDHIESKFPGLNLKLKIKTMDEHLDLSGITIPSYGKDNNLDYFIDYKKFITKDVVYPEWVDDWIKNSIVLIQDGGDQFFLTKNKTVDPDSKEETIYYKPVKCDKVLKSLQINISLFNPFFDPKFFSEWASEEPPPEYKPGTLNYLKIQKTIDTKLGLGTSRNPGYIKQKLEKSELQTFGRSDFYPYLKSKGIPKLYECFNVFTGFPLEMVDVDYGDIKFEETLIYKHLKEIMCNSDEGEFNHFLDHLADIIQDPANIKPNAHLFYSKQGTGKGLMAEWFKRLIGKQNSATIINLDRYFGSSFNVHQSHKLLKIFEEVSEKGQAYNQYNRLKGEISAPTEDIEPKGIDSWQVRNCARLWFFTNNKNSLYIEGDDRRYTLHEINNSKADNHEYFTPIWKEINDIKFLKCAFDYLAARKYTNESARKCYETKYKKEQKFNNLPKGIQFIKYFIEMKFNKKDIDKPINKMNMTMISANYLKSMYKTWCETNGIKFNASTLKTQLKKVGLSEPRRIQFQGKRVLHFETHPQQILNGIRILIKDELFDFDWGVMDDEITNNFISGPEFDDTY